MISEGGTPGLGVHLLGEHRSGRPQSKQADEPPECPRCGRAMGLTRVVPSMFDQAQRADDANVRMPKLRHYGDEANTAGAMTGCGPKMAFPVSTAGH